MIAELHERMLEAWKTYDGYVGDDAVATEALISTLDAAVDAYCAAVLHERGV